MKGSGEFVLDEEGRRRLADAVESAARVTLRHQFYLWDQGPVQALLPHDILICGIANGAADGLEFHRFCITRDFRDEHFAAVCDPHAGLLARLVARWRLSGRPVLAGPAAQPEGVPDDLVRALAECGLRNVAALGATDASGRIAGFFAYSRVPCALGPHLSYVMALLLPVYLAAFTRVLRGERERATASASVQRRGGRITPREAEILGWVKQGKTNSDIARILELSPWTVKNHIQAILKKLAVENRSHAVARAIGMGILNATE